MNLLMSLDAVVTGSLHSNRLFSKGGDMVIVFLVGEVLSIE